MFKKKGTLDVFEIILITFLSAFIFIYFLVILSQHSSLIIDEKKINTQLIFSKLFNGKCFSQDFATFKASQLEQDNLNSCFRNTNDKILFRIKVLSKTDYLYSGNNDNEFIKKKAYCNLESNILCSRMVFPVTFINENNIYSTEKLLIETIAY